MRPTIKNSQTLGRFIVVGGANTAIDFGVLFLLKMLGVPVLGANIISTTVAFIFSFFANKKYTFKTTDTDIKREMSLFVAVTLSGLWILQSIVIHITTPLFGTILNDENLSLFAAKLLATAVSMTWNYILYSKLVFIKR